MPPIVLADALSVAQAVAHWMLARVLAQTGPVAVALSGGSTPELLYQTLAQEPFLSKMPWDRVHWFWGDERFVPHTDPLSNYRMVCTALLDQVPVPREHIHPVPVNLESAAATALAYAQELQAFYGAVVLNPQRPLFTINLLGLGTDGHTASLFPGTAALTEQDQWVTAVSGAKAEDRITLTYPLLNSSQAVAFLVTGSAKQAVLQDIWSGTSAAPAARIQPVGELWWFVDRAALPQSD